MSISISIDNLSSSQHHLLCRRCQTVTHTAVHLQFIQYHVLVHPISCEIGGQNSKAIWTWAISWRIRHLEKYKSSERDSIASLASAPCRQRKRAGRPQGAATVASSAAAPCAHSPGAASSPSRPARPPRAVGALRSGRIPNAPIASEQAINVTYVEGKHTWTISAKQANAQTVSKVWAFACFKLLVCSQ